MNLIINKEYANKNWQFLCSNYIWLTQSWHNLKFPAVCYSEDKKVWLNTELKEIKSERHGRTIFKHPDYTDEEYLEQLIEVIKIAGAKNKSLMELPYSIQNIPEQYELDKNSKLDQLISDFNQATAPTYKPTKEVKKIDYELNDENLMDT